ncbi:MAG TPA: hypothetical protein VNW73_16965 [Ktedonobacteraceae bacterium]|jgi:hypothetical protein|nr:hypothetical protein [Ktedonobacteraceae bacterium]
MLNNQHLYEKELEMRRRDLLHEMEKRQLLAHLPKQLNMSRRAAGTLGVLLLKLGMRLKQLEHPQAVFED